jgi:hypothetical protein
MMSRTFDLPFAGAVKPVPTQASKQTNIPNRKCFFMSSSQERDFYQANGYKNLATD